jgi:hypothetical protein
MIEEGAAGNEPRLVGLHEPPYHRLLPVLRAFAPKPYLAYDGANDSQNGKKEAPS